MPKHKRTRREFLAAGGGTTALVTSIQPVQAGAFSAEEHATLTAAMDEIIPAADGMPSATQAGALEYLERVAPSLPGVLDQFRRGLAGLEAQARKLSGQSFAKLTHDARVDVLRALERDGELFSTLRDFTYEAYYTRPKVWQRLGYELHPTDHQGPHMKPFDESVLAAVLQRGKFYREVK
jgi:hypothetical protein